MIHGLRDIRVIDFSDEIAGPYTTKLFADAGADVIKVEPPEGDPMRTWSASGADLQGQDGAFFQFLHTRKRSVIGRPEDPEILALIEGADLVVESFEPGVIDALDLTNRFPGLVVLSISPWGRGGPYTGRPATEFTIQAECGSIAGRGLPSQPPIMAGGRITEWVGGTFAAVAAQSAVRRAQQTGHGEHIDFSLLEVMNIASTSHSDLMDSMVGRRDVVGPIRTVEIPSIEPTADGWVGFNTNSRQQYNDFLVLIERPDLLDDEEFPTIVGRWARADEWNEIVRTYTRKHTTNDIVEKASLLRIPVAPVNDGKSVLEHPHFQARGVFLENPGGGFLQPRPSWRINGETARPLVPAPALGEHDGQIEAHERASASVPRPPEGEPPLPLEGIRVLDATAWWAGPSSTQMLGYLGAEVIHLEAIQRLDGMRMMGGTFAHVNPRWYEMSGIYLAANNNKLGLTLDLNQDEGLELARSLISRCDVFVENFSPRVVEKFDLDWDTVHALNPATVMVRMPAFGLDGPWRDNVGFAQTMEQMSGLAWLTGHVDDQPRIQRGPCDPLAGMHAAFAALVGLAQRDETGLGSLLECTMVEGALNAASEQLVEYSAYGAVLQRDGNRAPYAAPQGVYACAGVEQWLALSIANDDQWRALVGALGNPSWASNSELATHAGRRAAHDTLDAELSAWAADRDLSSTVEKLVALGIPAAPVYPGTKASLHPQMAAREFFETMRHPVAGEHPMATVPFRFVSRKQPWLRFPAPTVGQHNRQILGDLLGKSEAEISALEEREVIGTTPLGL